MAKTKISEFSTTAGNNTDINSINIAEGCAPSGINDAIRELMRQLKEFQTGGAGDSVNSGGDFSVATNKFTVASASGNTAVAGTLGVTGAATLSSTLAVTGTTTLTGALVANGNATLGDGSGDTVTVKGTPTLEVNPTLSGGTANGVLYLNGSKVATSGSALTFAGNVLAAPNMSISGVGNYLYFDTTGGGGSNFIQTVNDYDMRLYCGRGSTSYIDVGTSGPVFGIGGSEQMRLTSTGLGIGTSSPSAKLDVSSANFVGGPLISARYNTSNPRMGFGIGNANGFPFLGYNVNNSSASDAGTFDIAGYATRLRLDGGKFVFETSNASGTAGAAVTWNTYATLDSSGNLGLGVTPSAWYSGAKAFQFGGNAALLNNNFNSTIFVHNAFYDTAWRYIVTGQQASYYNQLNGTHKWYTAPSGTAGDAITFTQAMTLDASGNLGIGTTSPTQRLEVRTAADKITQFLSGSGAAVQWQTLNDAKTANVPLAISTSETYFLTGGSERARIDSSGNLLVGTTSASSSPANGFTVTGPAAITVVGIGHVTGSGSGTYYQVFNYDSSVIGSITQSGTTAVLYNVTSDQRLKENIVDAPEFGSVIDSIKVRSYDWKADGNHQRAGFVAQELVTVAPEAVHQPADPEEMMAVDYSKLVPMLVKEIQSLRARVSQLESN